MSEDLPCCGGGILPVQAFLVYHIGPDIFSTEKETFLFSQSDRFYAEMELEEITRKKEIGKQENQVFVWYLDLSSNFWSQDLRGVIRVWWRIWNAASENWTEFL